MIPESDIVPAEFPGPADCKDAIQKGLGRAVLWVRNGRWQDDSILLEACLNDLRYDRQCEDARGTWLWGIMEDAGAIDTFRESILNAASRIDDGLAAQQLCQFCVFYARRGDERFRQRLCEIISLKPAPDCPWLGEEELIELDGEAGFLQAARVRSNELLNREWEWHDGTLIDTANRWLGKLAVSILLDREALSSADVARYRQGWLAVSKQTAVQPEPSRAERMRQTSLADIIREAEMARNRFALFRGWGMHANETDLQVVLDRLLDSQEPEILVNYLRIFSNRPLPRFDERLLSLLDHGDENVRGRAITALAQNAHPAIRQLAIDRLRQRSAETAFVQLFIKNYQPGDENLLLENVVVPADRDECHGLFLDVIKILEQNPSASCRELALRAYWATPCSSCRHDAAKLLVNRQVAPAWLVEECRWDSVSETRELVQEPSK